MMQWIIRQETSADFRTVEELTREAFWGCMDNPTCDGEPLIVHRLRQSPDFVPELDLVAEIDGKIVAHILYSKGKILSSDGRETEVLGFGPLSVLPSWQKHGIGGDLLRYSLQKAADLGFRAVLIYGHPDYYPRFGFQPAHNFGITTPDGSSFDALMAFELFPGALDGISGSFHESSAYEITPEEASEFDRSFPPKQPASLLPITALTDRLPEDVGEAILKKNLPCVNSLRRFSVREMLEWEGMDEEKLAAINHVLEKLGRPKKLPAPPLSFQKKTVTVRKAHREDLPTLSLLATMLWEHHTTEELIMEFSNLITRKDAQFFLLYEGEEAAGFAQCQLRHDYVEGTTSTPVGYLEGIFVKENFRHHGHAAKLLAACEMWAAERGCLEFASDCEWENTESNSFHLATGFAEVNRIICFVKRLPTSQTKNINKTL